MSDVISRQAAIDAAIEATKKWDGLYPQGLNCEIQEAVNALPSAQPDARLKKIADLVDGTIDHFDRDDAMDLLYQIKEVLKNE